MVIGVAYTNLYFWVKQKHGDSNDTVITVMVTTTEVKLWEWSLVRKFNLNILIHYTRHIICRPMWTVGGPGSVVNIATGYGMDGPGIESLWGRDFPHLSIPALGPTQPPVQLVPGLSRGLKSGRGVTLTPLPLPVSWSRKGRATPLLPLWAVGTVQILSACTRVHCTFLSRIHTILTSRELT